MSEPEIRYHIRNADTHKTLKGLVFETYAEAEAHLNQEGIKNAKIERVAIK